MSVQLTEQDILNCLDARYRNFFDIAPLQFDSSVSYIFDGFIEAANIICKFADINKKVNIHFVFDEEKPFKSEHFTLKFSLRDDAFHIKYDNSLFFYVKRVLKYSNEFQVASYLEELTHFFMNINDEILVKQVVCLMYPYIKYDPLIEFYTQKTT